MGKTAEDLRYDLEQQREALGRDLVAIGDRVSPGRMVERRRAAIRQSFGRARDAVMGAADTATTRTADTTGSAQSSVASAASSVGESVSSAASTAADAVTSAPQAIQSQTQGNPLAAGLIAFGAGALAGTLLPTSRREAQMVRKVQPVLEDAASELGEQAQAVAEQAKQEATEAAEQLKDEAKSSAQTVKAEAQGAAEAVKSDSQAAVESVKADAEDAAGAVGSKTQPPT